MRWRRSCSPAKAGVQSLADMGVDLGGGLTMVELGWMRTREWAQTVDDVLDRTLPTGWRQRRRVNAGSVLR